MSKKQVRQSKLQLLLERIRAIGFEYAMVSIPNRSRRIIVWTFVKGNYRQIFFAGPLWKVENFLEALLLGYEVGCHQQVQVPQVQGEGK
jgi:hypothetical protein